MSDQKEFLIGFFSIIAIILIVLSGSLYIVGDPMLPDFISFGIAAHYIASVYPLPFSNSDTFDYAEEALFEELDPFSYRIDNDEYRYLMEELSGEYSGIGISVIPRDSSLLIITVRENGPGHLAGIKSGDMILAVDGDTVDADYPDKTIGRIRGPVDTELSLLLYRPIEKDTIEMTLSRGKIKLNHLTYYGLTDDSLAYIRIADFESGTADDLEKALEKLEKLDPRGYIIDLKGNPGGYLNEAIDAADLFLEEGLLIVGTEGRSRWESQQYHASRLPLTSRATVILTDRGTASAAEIFSGALRGAGSCIVVGDTTFGKGLVQSVFNLSNNDALRLTTSRYYFADGRFLNPPDSELTFSGLPPDIYYKYSKEHALLEWVMTDFLLYDFIEDNWQLLAAFPDQFRFPDTVITLFHQYAQTRGYPYQSHLTHTLNDALQIQLFNGASRPVIGHLDKMLQRSMALDRGSFPQMSRLLKYLIQRTTVERKSGRSVSYREVVVRESGDIALAGEILHDSASYRAILKANSTK